MKKKQQYPRILLLLILFQSKYYTEIFDFLKKERLPIAKSDKMMYNICIINI